MMSLVYTSTASQPFGEGALEDLLSTCRTGNDARGVTGVLLYRDGRFIQVLEGQRETVLSLVATIGRDDRHHGMRILLTEELPARRFAAWTMGYRAFRTGSEAAPAGYRDSFADLEASDDDATTQRALSELTLWFRVRSDRPVAPASLNR